MAQDSVDYKKYLDPSLVSKLNSLELKARSVVEGFIVGLHKSPYHGFSVEFSEHRPYMQGDTLKNVDWKIYGKTEKYFIKQFEEETNLRGYVVLDISRSMDFAYEKNIKKIEYASILAASLIYIMLKQQDAAGLMLYSEKIESIQAPKSSRNYLTELLKTISNIKPSNKTQTAASLNLLAEKIKKRGLVIVISDLFDDVEKTLSALKHFRYKKNEVIVFQILDPVERNFAFDRDAVFKDLETGEEMTTQPHQIQKAYQETMREFIEKIQDECLNNGIEYNLIDTSMPFDKALYSYFKKRGKLL